MSTPEAAWELQRRARALMDLRRWDEALQTLARASAADPDAAEPHGLRGEVLARLARLDEAETAVREAVVREPEESGYHRLLSAVLLKRGQKAPARAAALEAVRLDPEEPRSLVVLAEALQATRDEAGALAAIRRAVQIDPHDKVVHDAHGRLLLAHGDLADAEAAFRRALALDPEDEDVLNNLSITLAARNRQDEAASGIAAAARLDPADELIRRNVRVVAYQHPLGRIVRGIAHAVAIIATVSVVIASLGGSPLGPLVLTLAIAYAVAFVLFELGVQAAAWRADPATARFLRDDRRVRRFRPERWDWTWLLSLRPFWWILLQEIPPPWALVANIALGFVVPIAFLGVPFSAWRAWRWYRRHNPGRGSWAPDDR